MTSDRLCTEAELGVLARPFADLLAAALADAPDDAVAVFDEAVRAYQAGVRGFHVWATTIWTWVLEHDGPEALEPLAEATAHGIAWRTRVPPATRTTVDAARCAVAQGSVQALKELALVEGELRYHHDVALDWVSALLSHVYRTYGPDALEASMRKTGEATLLAWMPRDVEHPPKVRVAQWARLLKGNFASISIAEHDDRFVITQDPCGSCGRQLSECAYPGPLDLAVVTDDHPLTRGGRPTTVYRTHAVLMHEIVPLERLGVPWPIVGCPDGLTSGPCSIALYKDPFDPGALATRDAPTSNRRGVA